MAREMAEAITLDASNKGRLIEAGWLAFVATCYGKGMPADQHRELRSVFFAGAHHLFASIMNVLEEGEEPTEADMRRMDLIRYELDGFLQEYKREHDIPDDIVPPETGARQ
jgi:hypothetical protein